RKTESAARCRWHHCRFDRASQGVSKPQRAGAAIMQMNITHMRIAVAPLCGYDETRALEANKKEIRHDDQPASLNRFRNPQPGDCALPIGLRSQAYRARA